jgi:hypothetical protein
LKERYKKWEDEEEDVSIYDPKEKGKFVEFE